jgi:hypothetical protein
VRAPNKLSLSIFSSICLITASAAGAQGVNHLEDRWQLLLSGAEVHLGSKLRVDENGEGTLIDIERILGLKDSRFQPRIAGTWSISRKHEIELGYQWVRRDAGAVLSRDIVFRDSTYHLGASVNTSFNSDQLFGTYRWAFRVRDQSEYGLSVGFGALFLDFGLAALTSGPNSTIAFENKKTATEPSASIGLYGKWRPGGSNSYIGADGRGIKVAAGDFDATVWEGNVEYRYYFGPMWGGELGWGISDYSVDVTEKNSSGGNRLTQVRYNLMNWRFGLVLALQ